MMSYKLFKNTIKVYTILQCKFAELYLRIKELLSNSFIKVVKILSPTMASKFLEKFLYETF